MGMGPTQTCWMEELQKTPLTGVDPTQTFDLGKDILEDTKDLIEEELELGDLLGESPERTVQDLRAEVGELRCSMGGPELPAGDHPAGSTRQSRRQTRSREPRHCQMGKEPQHYWTGREPQYFLTAKEGPQFQLGQEAEGQHSHYYCLLGTAEGHLERSWYSHQEEFRSRCCRLLFLVEGRWEGSQYSQPESSVKAQYEDPLKGEKTRTKLKHRQQGNRPVQEFAVEFCEHAAKVRDWNEEVACEIEKRKQVVKLLRLQHQAGQVRREMGEYRQTEELQPQEPVTLTERERRISSLVFEGKRRGEDDASGQLGASGGLIGGSLATLFAMSGSHTVKVLQQAEPVEPSLPEQIRFRKKKLKFRITRDLHPKISQKDLETACQLPKKCPLETRLSSPQQTGQGEAALLEQLQGELSSSQQAHQVEMDQLRGKLQRLQQELDVCKGRNQDNLCKLQARECTVEQQGLDLDLLLRQCQVLKEQLIYYEEVTQQQESVLSQQQEQERRRQEQLAQAEHSARVLESSLGLYKKKYQASLGRAGELESQVQRLEELASQAKEREEAARSLQEELQSQCCQAEGTIARLARELRGAREELTQGRHLTSQREEAVQELQEQLAASHTKLLDQGEALAALQQDFVDYKASHTYCNSSYESQVINTETLRQKLLQVESENSEHQRQAEEYQSLVRDLKRELVRVAEQKNCARQEAAHLELEVQGLRLEAAAEQERRQLEAAGEQQRGQQLEAELQQCRQLCAQKEQAIQKRDEVLRKSQLEMVRARSALQEKGREVARQRAGAQQLETSLQRAQQELQRSQREGASLRTEAQALQQSLRESQEQQRQAAQELAQQKELVQLAQSSLSHAQEELGERVAEVMHHMQAGRQMETELQALKDRLAGAEVELEQKRVLLEELTEELSESKLRYQAAAQESKQHQQAATQLELKLESSREGLKGLQQQVQRQESTLEMLHAEVSQQKHREDDLEKQLLQAKEHAAGLAHERKGLQQQLQTSEQRWQEEEQKGQHLQCLLTEREADNRLLREQLKQQAARLEVAQGNLEHTRLQLQQQTAEALQQEAALAQLHTELHAAQEREQQGSHSLAAAKDIAQDLKRQLASCQASQKEALEQLEQRGREVSCLQADLQLSRHHEDHLEEELAACQERTQQLRGQLQALQRQQQEEACCSEERLGEMDRQVQHWQQDHRAAEQALADKDEELVVLKVELAALEEKWHAAAEERGELQNELSLLRQNFVVSSKEVETLQTSLEAARSDGRRLHQESELMVANVSQWVKEQKQVNEQLGHKIRDQIKQIAQLTGEKEHLQGLTERLQQENKRLKNQVDEWRIEQERLKALRCNTWDSCEDQRQPWHLLPREDQCAGWRRCKALATKWDRP
ncbi:polyamine-modulated factor 1-binding protein 1 [Eublepharis macularius]|uniref:Polyamine-modulated factor 1-binding protein 1 n=1 Tax=Eublepharis macularius TaxID=481883 RepID=A0AA97KIW2_EUBMA|nr:polyamine-modulated factor 1-binding protein 1 [Eublepharis macularius]